jgi:hypothetical protein
MVSSTLGFIYSSEGSNEYNGHKFTLTERGWTTYDKNTGQYWNFNYLPNELDFESNLDSLSSKSYVVLDDDAYFYDLSSKFALFGVILERISPEDVDCSLEETTLVFEDGFEYNKIYKEGNCVYLKGDKSRLIDKLFYHILGVI